jgi:hypothetical protein
MSRPYVLGRRSLNPLTTACIRSSIHPTTEVSDRRRQGRWIARGASEWTPSVERRSRAAVRLHRLVRHFGHFFLAKSSSHLLSSSFSAAVRRRGSGAASSRPRAVFFGGRGGPPEGAVCSSGFSSRLESLMRVMPPNVKGERPPPTQTVERARRSRIAVRCETEKRGRRFAQPAGYAIAVAKPQTRDSTARLIKT